MEKIELIAMLKNAIAEQRRCMGGVDPPACVTAAQRVTALREMFRNDSAFITHLQSVIALPPPTRRRR